jgi:hypothetical protein
MSIEVSSAKNLVKGLNLWQYKIKSDAPKNKNEENKPKSKNATTNKVSADKSSTKQRTTKTSIKSKSSISSEIPTDMRPTPIGLSNTSNLPAINLSGIGTRSKQFKGK